MTREEFDRIVDESVAAGNTREAAEAFVIAGFKLAGVPDADIQAEADLIEKIEGDLAVEEPPTPAPAEDPAPTDTPVDPAPPAPPVEDPAPVEAPVDPVPVTDTPGDPVVPPVEAPVEDPAPVGDPVTPVETPADAPAVPETDRRSDAPGRRSTDLAEA